MTQLPSAGCDPAFDSDSASDVCIRHRGHVGGVRSGQVARDRWRHGWRHRAPMDGFTACPALPAPAAHTPTTMNAPLSINHPSPPLARMSG
ncbi:hypothetical protein BN1263500187 [Stenotrophomonas indicatrix]|nr:hypothetical protein BN1263500187 [Stenotrophomonas indicatrix]